MRTARRWQPPVPVAQLDRYFGEIKASLDKHGFGDIPGDGGEVVARGTAGVNAAATGVAVDLPSVPSDSEVLERWMEREEIPKEVRPKLRTRTAEYRERLAAERPGSERERHREAAARLHGEGTVLEQLLWHHRREVARTTKLYASLPRDFVEEVAGWNKRVLALADDALTVK